MKKFKKVAPTILIICALLLSGCGSKQGKTATNIDTSTGEVLSQDSLDRVSGDIIKNIKNYVKNAPSLDNVDASDAVVKLDYNSELEKRKNNFVLCSEEDTISENDIVNLSFIEISLSSGEATYELNLGYNFDLSSDIDSSFKNGLIGKPVGDKVVIENCKMPDGATSKVKVKVNYIVRKAENFESFKDLLPSGAESYEKWLEASLDKASIVNDVWSQILKQVSIDENADGYKEYFDRKYNNAYEYYLHNIGENIDEAALKNTIKEQIKKELVAYFYAAEYDIDYGEYKDEELKNIALYYGYTVDAFKAKYSESVIDDTMLIDMVGVKIFENASK